MQNCHLSHNFWCKSNCQFLEERNQSFACWVKGAAASQERVKENGKSWKGIFPVQGQDLQLHNPFVGRLKSSSGFSFGSKSQHPPAAPSCNACESQ